MLPIASWIDGFRMLSQLAITTRGAEPAPIDSATECPRTTERDVVVVAKVFWTSILDYLPPGLSDDWIDDVVAAGCGVASAPASAARVHDNNPWHWHTLGILADQLDRAGAPLPAPRAWDVAARQFLGLSPEPASSVRRTEIRFVDYPAMLWGEMAEIQRHVLLSYRGAEDDHRERTPQTPRTTYRDVVQLAIYWTEQLTGLGQTYGEIDPQVRADWSDILTQIDSLSRGARLYSPYPLAVEFWRAVRALADAGDAELAGAWRHYLDGVGDPPPRNAAPEAVIDFSDVAKTYDEIALLQRAHYSTLRGEDIVSGARIPRTLNADVVHLVGYWTEKAHKVSSHLKDVSAPHVLARWADAIADVERFTRSADPAATYPRNAEFWFALGAIAVQTAVTNEAPTRGDLLWDTAKDAIPHAASVLAGAPADLLVHEALKHADDVANGAADLLSALKRYALYAGGGIAALALVAVWLANSAKERA
jgi:hypothetical protein